MRIKLKTPEFWSHGNGRVIGQILSPLGLCFRVLANLNQRLQKPAYIEVPVICIGNAVVGGAGKTPVALSLGNHLISQDIAFGFLSRGYGGKRHGPYKVDPKSSIPEMVGDESLLLSKIAPTWISRDRYMGAKAAMNGGAQLIVMDDGLQNFSIQKDISILVVDGSYGFGNGKVFPAGPLREPLKDICKRINFVVIIGTDKLGIREKVLYCDKTLPIFCAHVSPLWDRGELKNNTVVAFAGIAQPEKFFATLEGLGCHTIHCEKYPDHYFYNSKELLKLKQKAKESEAILLTTEKDWVRIPKEERVGVDFLAITLEWEDVSALDTILNEPLKSANLS